MITMQQPRICYIIPSLAPGGTERQLLCILEGLRQTHACSVICTRTAGAWSDEAKRCGAHLVELGTRGGWDVRVRARIRKVLGDLKPHIVQTFLFGLDLPACRAARDAGVPVVVSSRRELAAWMKPRHLHALKRANGLVDCIVANSNAVARYAARIEDLAPDRILVIHNGIDFESIVKEVGSIQMRARLRIPDGKTIIGMLANFSPVKDHDLFLATATILLQRHREIHFLLVGSGPLEGNVQATVRRLGMQDHFTITSTSTDAASLLGIMDVCVLTSLREGFPNAMLEAMALRRPVVAASVGGVPELIDDGVTGLLVSSRDPAEFAAAILRITEDRDLARAMGERAGRHVRETFSAERMVRSYRALYDGLLARAGVTGPCAASAE